MGERMAYGLLVLFAGDERVEILYLSGLSGHGDNGGDGQSGTNGEG